MKLLLFIFLPLLVIYHPYQDAKNDVSIISGTGKCGTPYLFKKIKNNSDTRTITVTINEIAIFGKGRSTITRVIDTINPKEEMELGCAGCIATGEGNECTFFSIKSAAYITP